jgi:hypothetical protein
VQEGYGENKNMNEGTADGMDNALLGGDPQTRIPCWPTIKTEYLRRHYRDLMPKKCQ